MSDVNITIIGAGVVGLAIAEKLSQKHTNIFVIEQHPKFGQETSSRNSEVIHAGIYYPKNSLKAQLCVEGKHMLYDFCNRFELPYNRCGKMIVATTEDEKSILEELKQKAANNGVYDLRHLTRKEVKEYEPNIEVKASIFSPSTGVIDTHSFMKQLETNCYNNGCHFAYKSVVKNIAYTGNSYDIEIIDTANALFKFSSDIVINCAGLESYTISLMLGIDNPDLSIQFCKGHYYRINPPKNKLVTRLVYPVPNPRMEGIGIHTTIDMSGGVKLGPDVEYLDKNVYDYSFDNSKKKDFFQSARKFLPFLKIDDLSPEMVGIRPKTQKPGEPIRDFYIQHEDKRGLSGFVNLIGIESPGLTSSMAIAKYVDDLLQ